MEHELLFVVINAIFAPDATATWPALLPSPVGYIKCADPYLKAYIFLNLHSLSRAMPKKTGARAKGRNHKRKQISAESAEIKELTARGDEV